MLTELSALRIAAEQLEQGTLPSPTVRIWLAAAFKVYLDRRCEDLEEALGLRAARGGVPWWKERALRDRNAALRELAAALPQTGEGRVVALKQLIDRYGTTAWYRDREEREMPCRYVGTTRALLWRAFRSGARLPLSERQLRNIVGDP